MEEARPLVLSRTTTPQTSNSCLFHVESDPSSVFCAHAVEGGTIVVQQAPVGSLPPSAIGSGSAALAGARATAAAAAAARSSAAGDDSGSGGFTTVLLIDQPHLEDDECVCSISWGGGPLATLSAATRQSVALVSLAPFLEAWAAARPQAPRHASPPRQHHHHHQHAWAAQTQLPHRPQQQQQQQQQQHRHRAPEQSGATGHAAAADAEGALLMPSTLHWKLDVFRAKAPVLSHRWTHDGLGLLVSDAKGGLVMLQVLDSGGYGTAGPLGTLSAAADVRTAMRDQEGQHASGTEEAEGTAVAPRRHRRRLRARPKPRVKELWQTRADAAQHLIAAGACASGPCASVSLDSPLRVVVWWPGPSAKTGGWEVGAEVIRHPVRAVHLEWSPALGSSSSDGVRRGASAGVSGSAGEQQQQQQDLAAAGEISGGSGQQQGGGTCGDPPSAHHPALMTVGADGVMRVWVEVVMADADDDLMTHAPGATGAAAAAAAAASSAGKAAGVPAAAGAVAAAVPAAPRVMSQFCLTLVVEPPPGWGVTPGAAPGMLATWVRPLRSSGHSGSSRAGAGRSSGGEDPQDQAPPVLWLLASYCAPANTAAMATPPALPPPGSPLRSGAANASAPPPPRGGWVDGVFLWAVDGLSGVVLRGIAQNAITASKLSAPRAFLWGCDAAPGWRAPAALAAAAAAGGGGGGWAARHALAAWLRVGPGGAPLMYCAQDYQHTQSGYHELRHFLTQPLPLQSPDPNAPPTCGIVVHPRHARARGCEPAEWRAFSVHTSADLAAGIGREGRLALWGLAPVELLPIALARLNGGSGAALPQQGGAAAAAGLGSPEGGLTGLTASEVAEAAAEAAALPSSWTDCSACCWLPAPSRGGAGPYLLATCSDGSSGGGNGGGRLQIAAVSIARRAPLSAGGAAGSVGAAGPAAVVTRVELVADTPLPPGVTSIRSLVELAPGGEPDAIDGASEATLVALASFSGVTGSDGRGSDSGGAGRERDAWVVWRVSMRPQAAAAGGSVAAALASTSAPWAVSVTPAEVCTVSAAAAAAGACGGASAAAGEGEEERPASGFRLRLPSPLGGRSRGAAGDEDESGSDGGAASISCLHRPSPASPFLMTGDVQGRMQVWQVLSAPAAAALERLCGDDGDSRGASGGSQRGSDSGTCAGGAVQLLQQNECGLLGMSLGGIAVGVALSTTAGYAATATTCGETDVEDAVYIWSAEGTTRSSLAPPGVLSPSARWPAGPFVLDALLPLDDTAAAVAWLESSGLPPVLAVGYASGELELYARDRSGQWNAVASCSTHLTISHLCSNWQGLPLVVAGGQVLLLTNLVDRLRRSPRGRRRSSSRAGGGGACSPRGAGSPQPAGGEGTPEEENGEEEGEEEEEVLTHAGLAASIVPLHHPDALAALLTRGRLGAASRVLRRLLAWLRRASAAATASADAAAADAASAQAAGPVVPLEAALQVGLHQLPGADAVTRFRTAATRLALGPPLDEACAAAGEPASVAAAAAAKQQAADEEEKRRQQQQQQAPAPAPKQQALDTGLLDMSAFGDFGGFGGGDEPPAAAPAEPPPPPATPPRQAPAPPQQALETGMLDMSAFGDFGGFGGGGSFEDEAPPLAPEPAAPAPPPQQQQQQALETGMLDMSAFGDFGGFGGAPEEPSASSQQQQRPHVLEPSPFAVDTAAAAATGGDSTATAGGTGTGSSDPDAHAAGRDAEALLPLGGEAVPPEALAAVEAPFPRPPLPPGALAARREAAAGGALRVLSDAEAAELARLLGVPTPTDPSAAAADEAAGGGGGGGSGLAYYRRLLSDAGAAGGKGGDGGADSSSSAAARDAADVKSPEEEQRLQAAAELRRRLGLSERQARELAILAAALAARTFSAGQASRSGAAAAAGAGWGSSSGLLSSFRRPGGGSGLLAGSAADESVTGSGDASDAAGDEAKGEELPGPGQQLDEPGRLVVANVRLALLHGAAASSSGAGSANGGSGDRSAAAGRDQQRFAAAVARLFQPVSVSRSAVGGSSARGAALLAHYPTAADRTSGNGGDFTTTAAAAAGGGTPTPGPRLGFLRPPRGPSGGGGGAGDAVTPPTGLLRGSSRSRSRAALRAAGLAGAMGGGQSMRSSLSVASMLSFSSLREEGAGVEGESSARAKLGSKSWAEFVGLLPGLAPIHVLWALGTHEPGALLEVLLPLLPDMPEHSQAAPGTGASVASQAAGSGGSAAKTAITWPKLRAVGAGFWLSDHEAARQAIEQLARQQYASSKDPHDCALAYMALGKRTVLQGLFRSAGNKKVSEFLSRDFSDEAHRAAACKNAFHLLGQHRHQLAAAFFLLGGAHWDAVSLLAREAADPQLALMVARLVEGEAGGPLQRRLVDEELLLLAEADADPCSYCLATWARGDAPAAVQRLLAALAAAAPHAPSPALAAASPSPTGGGGYHGLPPPALAAAANGAAGGDSFRGGGTGPAALRAAGSRLSFVSVGGPSLYGGSPSPGRSTCGWGEPAGSAAAAGVGNASRHIGGSQAALLDWFLTVGVRQLAGHRVTGLLPVWVHSLALQCAHAAEVAGMPLAAAEALAVADSVGDPTAPPAAAQGQLALALDLMWHSRLAAACVLLASAPAAAAAPGAGRHGWAPERLPAMAAASSKPQQPLLPSAVSEQGQHAAGDEDEEEEERPWQGLPDPSDAPAWDDLVNTTLPPLTRLTGLRVDASAASACLRRHAAALRPAIHLDPWATAAAAAAGSGLSLSPRASSAAGRGGPTPDAALQICLSLAEDQAGGFGSGSTAGGLSRVSSLMASLPSLRRRASADTMHSGSVGGSPHGATPSRGGTARPSDSAKRSGAAGAAAARGAVPGGQQGLLSEGWDVAAAEGGDKVRALTAARGPGYGVGPSAACPRPFAFVSQRGGIRCGEVAAPAGEVGSPSHLGSQGSGSIFAGLMQQVLDHVRWPPDPWVVGEYPTRRSHSFGNAAMSQVTSGALAAHPARPLLVSGSASGHIYIWQFESEGSRAAYVPATSQVSKRTQVHEAVSTPHWGVPAALRFSRSGARFGAVGEGGLAGLWRQDFISAADGLGHAEWIHPCVAKHGADIEFLGDTGSQIIVAGQGDRGGVVALWDTLAPPSSARAAEIHLPARSSPTRLALIPSTAAAGGPGPGGLLVVGDDAGGLTGWDVRMLSDGHQLWTAAPHAGSLAGVTALAAWDSDRSGGFCGDGGGLSGGAGAGAAAPRRVPPMRLTDVVVSGGRDGSIAVVNVHSGCTVQHIECAHWTERRGLLGGRLGGGGGSSGASGSPRGGSGGSGLPARRPRPAGALPAAVTGLAACPEGLLSSGADGAVRFHPFSHVWSS